MNYHYYEADDKTTRWCWNVDPIYRCPNAEVTQYVAGDDGADGAHHLTRREDDIAEAAQLLGMDPVKLGLIVTRAHRSGHVGRARVDGKLTDRCAACGTKMRREGFRAWVSRLVDASDASDGERTSARIGSRIFGGDGYVWRDDPSKWFDTKKEARTWALEERKTNAKVTA